MSDINFKVHDAGRCVNEEEKEGVGEKNITKLREEKKKELELLTMMTATQPEEREGETCDQCAKRSVMKSGMGREQTTLFEGSKEESEEVEVLTMMTATQPEERGRDV